MKSAFITIYVVQLLFFRIIPINTFVLKVSSQQQRSHVITRINTSTGIGSTFPLSAKRPIEADSDYVSVSVSDEKTRTEEMSHVCKFCGEKFDSRNAIFRHLRSSKSCYDLLVAQSKDENGGDAVGAGAGVGSFLELKKRKVAIQFGYHVSSSGDDDDDTTNTDRNNGSDGDGDLLLCTNEVAAELVCEAFFHSLAFLYPSSPVEIADGGDMASFTFTLASGARVRHPSLMQEKSCSAWSDVVGINYKGGPENIQAPDFVNHMQQYISDHNNEGESRLFVKVINLETLRVSTKFHAEQSCTQRSYQYLIPVQWLDDSFDTLEWIRHTAAKTSSETSSITGTTTGHQIKKRKTPESLVKFKNALKLIESRDVTQMLSQLSTTAVPSSLSSSAGRYGKLWQKERRPFHNFCDPFLGSGGMANPSNEHVWRTVDRARLKGFIIDNEKDQNEAYVVVEFKGDGFVAQQVRRMVASAVAISNDWVPSEYFTVATRLDVNIETPIAPSGLLYFASPRFHFVDLIRGSTLFKTNDRSDNEELWLSSLQSKLMRTRAEKLDKEKKWFSKLKNTGSHRICSLLSKIASDDKLKAETIQKKRRAVIREDLSENFSAPPEHYRKTLYLLQDMSKKNKWPITSDALSRVIKAPAATLFKESPTSSVVSQFQGHLLQYGSFTIVNPKTFKGRIPLVNKQFPELVESIFELEKYHSSQRIRSCLNDISEYDNISSHCTVSRNVEFTPHFQNGKKQERTISTIVGLGDYVGGDFVVEGKPYNVRYDALQFDGWRQIHSTASNTFGEKFSLTWFTPQVREDQPNGDTCFEDKQAKVLVESHSRTLPFYSPLKFRQNSTDALVINEILDIECCTYELTQSTWLSISEQTNDRQEHQNGFSLKGHKAVLDIGAHIGVFCRFALSVGCEKIIAYEPELENLKLLRHNLQPLHLHDCDNQIIIYGDAVAHGEPGVQNFVNAKNRTDGSLNTWRHSLEKHSNYVDKKEKSLISKYQDSSLSCSKVNTIPFFGENGALKPGITFVKMDCEGAELDILLSQECSHKSNWLDVKNLVFEWSLTKERRVDLLHVAVKNLESAGFTVIYEGKNSWWDTEINCMWPYHSDLVVFAKMKI